jgi:hypothetical protein
MHASSSSGGAAPPPPPSPQRTCVCLLIPAATGAPLRIVSVPSFARGAPGWLDALAAHNAALCAHVADGATRQYDTYELAAGAAADGHAHGSVLLVSVADDFTSLPVNHTWRALSAAAGAPATQPPLRGAVLLQAAERPGCGDERMVDITRWADRRGRTHADASEWTDPRGALLRTLLGTGLNYGASDTRVGYSTDGVPHMQMGHSWRPFYFRRRQHTEEGVPILMLPEAEITVIELSARQLPPCSGVLKCAACLRDAAACSVPRLQRCAGCSGIVYCGAACQRADWAAHKAACRRVSGAAHTPLNEGERTTNQ